MHLQVSDLDSWNILSANAPQTAVGFNECLVSLKRSKFRDDAYDRQVDFLRLIKNPKDAEPSAFKAMLSNHTILLAEFPGAPAAAQDGKIRLIQDFRKLNSCVLRQQYVLPRIQDIFLHQRSYKYLTNIDLSMQYYSFVLDDESSWLCVFVTIFGKYCCLRLPMGLNQSPDWAQATMERGFWDMLDEIECYLDNMSVYDLHWSNHVPKQSSWSPSSERLFR
jgi:hypothetical protein